MRAILLVTFGVLGLQLAPAASADVPINPESLALHDAMFAKCKELQPQSSRQFTDLRHALFARVSDVRLESWSALPKYRSTYRSTQAALKQASRDQLLASCAALAKAKVSDIK